MTDLGDFEGFESRFPADASAASSTDRGDDPVGTDRGVGIVTASEGLSVSDRAGESRLRVYVTAPHRQNVRLGTYLLVPYPDGERLFCRVQELAYEHEFESDDATEVHARRAMSRGEFDELDYKLIASIEPIAILYDAGGELARRMTDRVPKPESIAQEAAEREPIKTGLKIPDDGIFLGHLAVGGEKIRTAAEPPTIDYRLADDYEVGDPLVFRHTLIAGGTGSGKTHTAKNVIRQFLDGDRSYPIEAGSDRRARLGVVQFDPQDEYGQMHDDNPEATRDDTRRWERESIAHGGHDDTLVMVPKIAKSTYSADHHRAEQLRFTIPFSMVRHNRWLIAGGRLNDNQYNALTVLLDRFFDDHGTDGTYRAFRDFLDTPALREELDDRGIVHEASFDAVKRRVQGFDAVFDQDAPPITEQVHRLVRPGGLTVVPTYHINDSRTASVVVLAVSSLLIDQKLSNAPRFDRIKETPLLLGMDEAHNFLADTDSVQARRVIGKFTEAAKQGRKERLGLFLITQDPADVADAVFSQINTKIVLNLTDDEAISAVNIPPTLQQRVPYMERGQMVVHSPDNSEPVELIGLPTCLTRHGRT